MIVLHSPIILNSRCILFIFSDYHDAKNLLNLDDLQSGLLGPYDMGAQGVVIWGSSAEANNPEFLSV